MLSLVAADELVGFLALRIPEGRRMDAEEREIAASIAGQTAVAIKKVELIDRLTERNAIKDLLEDLAHATATPEELGARARALGTDLDRPHLVMQAVPRPGTASRTWDEVADGAWRPPPPVVPWLAVRPPRRRSARADPARHRR